jgi:ArsR family transcriptional regulator
MKSKEMKILEAQAGVLKSLAHPTRLWIVQQLSNGPRCVCEFVNQIDADFSTVSRHLLVLKQAGVIEDEKRGKQVFYTLKTPCILNFLTCVNAVIENKN